jgi:peptidoglycan-associated lipoprotein
MGAGCAKDAAAPAGARGASEVGRSAATSGSAERVGAAPSTAIIYFDFDSSELDRRDVDVIAAWGKYLGSNADVRLTLVGHCDERGTREYNVALGERRAIAVRDQLRASGVGADQIAVVSYGEDRPAAVGQDEAAWSKNRRVEVILRQ